MGQRRVKLSKSDRGGEGGGGAGRERAGEREKKRVGERKVWSGECNTCMWICTEIACKACSQLPGQMRLRTCREMHGCRGYSSYVHEHLARGCRGYSSNVVDGFIRSTCAPVECVSSLYITLPNSVPDRTILLKGYCGGGP